MTLTVVIFLFKISFLVFSWIFMTEERDFSMLAFSNSSSNSNSEHKNKAMGLIKRG